MMVVISKFKTRHFTAICLVFLTLVFGIRKWQESHADYVDDEEIFVKEEGLLSTDYEIETVKLTKQSSDEDFEALFALRRRNLAKACHKYYGLTPNDSIIPDRSLSFKFMLVDEKHKTLFCSLPKVSSTNWRKVFAMLGSADVNLDDLDRMDIHDDNFTKQFLNLLSDYPRTSLKDITNILQTYKKILWVRDPFKRLVSAWKNKFVEENEIYGKRYVSEINKEYPQRLTKPGEKGSQVSLQQFLSFADEQIYLESGESGRIADVHWNMAHRHCLVCAINYTYIGRQENLEVETDYVLRRIGAPDGLTFPKKKPPSKEMSDFVDSQVKVLPKSLIRRVISRIRIDYETFGYEIPTV